MRAINKFKDFAAHMLELPKDAVYDVPRITLIGSLQLLVENHTGILEFSDSLIRLSHSNGVLAVTGKQLTIKYIQSREIWIEGEISGIKLG